MRVTVVFVRVVNKPEYNHGTQRWLESYLKYTAWYQHDLVIINRNGDSPDRMFDMPRTREIRMDGDGWDCGAWQFAGKNIDTDLLVCFNSSTYITGDGWLKRFVDAVQANGDGLYGPMASLEVLPHIRTPCMIFQPHVIKDYPVEVQTRDDTWKFEVFGFTDQNVPNFTQWVQQKDLPTLLVTWDGVYAQDQWRKPPNIFRRGDQSNLIICDRHADAYTVSDAEGKTKLERLADGI